LNRFATSPSPVTFFRRNPQTSILNCSVGLPSMRWNSLPDWLLGTTLVTGCCMLLAHTSMASSQQASPTPTPTPTPAPSPSPSPAASPQAPKHTAPEFLVMIDPSHGGDDTG